MLAPALDFGAGRRSALSAGSMSNSAAMARPRGLLRGGEPWMKRLDDQLLDDQLLVLAGETVG